MLWWITLSQSIGIVSKMIKLLQLQAANIFGFRLIHSFQNLLSFLDRA